MSVCISFVCVWPGAEGCYLRRLKDVVGPLELEL